MVTFTTVGYGDFDFGGQDNGNSELMGVAFIVIGVFIFGASLSMLFSYVLEEEQLTILTHARDREMGRERRQMEGCYAKFRRCIRRRVAPWDESDKEVGLASAAKQEAVGRLKVNLTIAVVREMSILCFGATVLGYYEDWDWRNALYWAVTTATTVGFGDVVPTTEFGRLLASILILLSVCSLTHTMSIVASFRTLMTEVRARHEVLTQFGTTLTQEEFDTLTHGPEVRALRLCSSHANITEAEFCLYMLHKLGRVAKEELLACQDAFHVLDITHTGKIDSRDLKEHEHRRITKWGDAEAQEDSQDVALTQAAVSLESLSFADLASIRMSRVFNGAQHDLEVCTACGGTFMEDAAFCRRCGKPRPGQRRTSREKNPVDTPSKKSSWLSRAFTSTDPEACSGKKSKLQMDDKHKILEGDSCRSRLAKSMCGIGSARTGVGCVLDEAEHDDDASDPETR